MKYRRITAMLVVLTLIAITFVATVAAIGEVHSAYLISEKKGKDITFTIETNFDTEKGFFLAYDVDPSSISILIYDQKGDPLPEITPDQTQVEFFNTYTIKIYLVKQDGIPAHTTSVTITGDIVTGDYAGDTFSATGPGFAWGRW